MSSRSSVDVDLDTPRTRSRLLKNEPPKLPRHVYTRAGVPRDVNTRPTRTLHHSNRRTENVVTTYAFVDLFGTSPDVQRGGGACRQLPHASIPGNGRNALEKLASVLCCAKNLRTLDPRAVTVDPINIGMGAGSMRRGAPILYSAGRNRGHEFYPAGVAHWRVHACRSGGGKLVAGAPGGAGE